MAALCLCFLLRVYALSLLAHGVVEGHTPDRVSQRSRSPRLERRTRSRPLPALEQSIEGIVSAPHTTMEELQIIPPLCGQSAIEALVPIEHNICLYDSEPDATTCCSQLLEVLTGPYHHTHLEYLDELASQVTTGLVGDDLRRSLLLLFIQYHREQFRRYSAAGPAAFECGLSRHVWWHYEIALRSACHCRFRRWRTHTWMKTLQRGQARHRRRKRRRSYLQHLSKVFGRLSIWTRPENLLCAWFGAHVHLHRLIVEKVLLFLGMKCWHIIVVLQPYATLLPRLQCMTRESTAPGPCRSFLVCSFASGFRQQITPFRSRLCSWTSPWSGCCTLRGCLKFHILRISFSCFATAHDTSILLGIMFLALAESFAVGYSLFLWSILYLTILGDCFLCVCVLVLYEQYFRHCCVIPRHPQPCLFIRSRRRCRFVAHCKYIGNYMEMMNFPPRRSPCQILFRRRFPSWLLGDRIPLPIRYISTQLHMYFGALRLPPGSHAGRCLALHRRHISLHLVLSYPNCC